MGVIAEATTDVVCGTVGYHPRRTAALQLPNR